MEKTSRSKRSRDPVQAAVEVGRIATGQSEEKTGRRRRIRIPKPNERPDMAAFERKGRKKTDR